MSPRTLYPVLPSLHRKQNSDNLSHLIQTPQDTEGEQQNLQKRVSILLAEDDNLEEIKSLDSKLKNIIENSKIATPDISQKLEHLEKNVNKANFLELIQEVITWYNQGFCSYKSSSHETFELFHIFNKCSQTESGKTLLRTDIDVFNSFGTAFILIMSKKLAMLFPKEESLLNEFSEVSEVISAIQWSFQNGTPEHEVVKTLLARVSELNHNIEKALKTSMERLSNDLVHLLIPHKGLSFTHNKVQEAQFPKGDRRKAIDNIIKELIRTELEYNQKIETIVNTTLFKELIVQNIIDSDEEKQLCEGWAKLYEQSLKMVTNLNIAANMVEGVLIAFSPQNIEEYMEAYKQIVCKFVCTNKIIQKIRSHPTGLQRIADHKVNRLDLVDIWIMPVQRPLRYPMLLKDLINCFEDLVVKKALSDRLNYVARWAKAINLLSPKYG
jgi:hypothetical protein